MICQACNQKATIERRADDNGQGYWTISCCGRRYDDYTLEGLIEKSKNYFADPAPHVEPVIGHEPMGA